MESICNSRPKAIWWFNIYFGFLGLIYLAYSVYSLKSPTEEDRYLFLPLILLSGVCLLPLFLRPRRWFWSCGLILICVSCIPLLFFWLKPNVKSYFLETAQINGEAYMQNHEPNTTKESSPLHPFGWAMILAGVFLMVTVWLQPLGGHMLAGSRNVSGEQFVDMLKQSGIDPLDIKQYGGNFFPIAERVEQERQMRTKYTVILSVLTAAGVVFVIRYR